ncbi:MAG: hypothetical protein QOF77_1960 [Solirubrobacteraceae bacterium]|jgi:tetratricopeptide (TPR) repeat protein|nr:hypothetical protein [Solirubrobacteraceae bacterium]
MLAQPSGRASVRWAAILAAGVAVLALAGYVLAGSDRPAATPPARPAPGSSLGLALRPGQTTSEQIAVLQAAAAARPGDAEVLASLGLAYYQRVRETGDFSFYARAEGVLDHAVRSQPTNLTATVGLATVALARHDFRGGLRYSERARQLDPRGVQGYAGMVDGLVELGRYREAGRALQRFVDLRPGLPAYARVSYFRELHGDLAGAIDAMSYAVSAGGEAPENVAYVETLLGDLRFLSGGAAAARTAYLRALAGVAHYVPAEVGLAQLDAAAGRLPAAIAGLRDAVARLPLPQYVVALGEDELAAGRPAAARRDFAIIGVEERLLRANGVNTDVDLALYEANHGDPARAVALGRRAWGQAPSVRSADALGWALTRAGRPGPGLGWARRALSLGSADPGFLYHAGIAARASGHRGEARADLERALARNPRFSPLYGPLARRALESVR